MRANDETEYDIGVREERERIVTWLRWLNDARRSPEAKAALDRILSSGKPTVECLAVAIENGERIPSVRRPE